MDIAFSANAPVVPHRRHWQFCVGSGHALLALRTDYTQQLRFIHDTLGIERVRFHGIFCDDMRTCNDLSMQMPIPGAEAFTEYNFNNCALAYDNVLAAGMKPFVELSFMPEKLALKEEGRPLRGSFFYKPIIVPPADYEAWQDYIRAFIRFLIHQYGAEEVRTWYFEVWNEPDLTGPFFNGTQEEYFRLYAETAAAIKSVDPAIPVGGPATSNSKWVERFVSFCRENQVPVDFITTHQYAGDPLGGVEDQGDDDGNSRKSFDFEAHMAEMAGCLTGIQEKTFLNGFRATMPDKSETTDIPNDLFRRNVVKVRKQAGSLPVYYTEWNENAIFSAYTNDTRKVAAYDVKAALEVADHIDGSSIWCFSDIFEELHPFPQEFHGGFGMLTQHGIPKPVYYAMRMLRDAGDSRLNLGPDATLGEIGYAAFRADRTLDLILFRQNMKNLDLPKTPVEIAISDCPASTVSVLRIDEDHANPLKLWEAMGSPVMLNPREIEDLRTASTPQEESWQYTCENGTTRLSAALGVNDVYRIRIQLA